jgi:hypothetical protein
VWLLVRYYPRICLERAALPPCKNPFAIKLNNNNNNNNNKIMKNLSQGSQYFWPRFELKNSMNMKHMPTA